MLVLPKAVRLAAVALLFVSSTSHAREIRVVGFDLPPSSMGSNGKLGGLGLDVVQALAERTSLTIGKAEVLNIQRLLQTVEEENVFYTALGRTAERDKMVFWIGKLLADSSCFVTKKGRVITSLQEAKKLRAIGVNGGGKRADFLKAQGFTNIEPVPLDSINLKKLDAGRIDAWFASDISAAYDIKTSGLKPQDFVCGGDFMPNEYYLAVSRPTKQDIVEKCTKEFSEMERRGEIAKMRDTYLRGIGDLRKSQGS